MRAVSGRLTIRRREVYGSFYSAGYARLKENVTNGKADNHEGLDFYRPVEQPDKSNPLCGENQWPSVLGFRKKYEIWVEKMKTLGLIVMEAYVAFSHAVLISHLSSIYSMALGLGMSPEEWADLRSQVDHSFWVMRVIGSSLLLFDINSF